MERVREIPDARYTKYTTMYHDHADQDPVAWSKRPGWRRSTRRASTASPTIPAAIRVRSRSPSALLSRPPLKSGIRSFASSRVAALTLNETADRRPGQEMDDAQAGRLQVSGSVGIGATAAPPRRGIGRRSFWIRVVGHWMTWQLLSGRRPSRSSSEGRSPGFIAAHNSIIGPGPAVHLQANCRASARHGGRHPTARAARGETNHRP